MSELVELKKTGTSIIFCLACRSLMLYNLSLLRLSIFIGEKKSAVTTNITSVSVKLEKNYLNHTHTFLAASFLRSQQ